MQGIPNEIDDWIELLYFRVRDFIYYLHHEGKIDPMVIDYGSEEVDSYGLVFTNEDSIGSDDVDEIFNGKIKDLYLEIIINTLPNEYKDNIHKNWSGSYDYTNSIIKDDSMLGSSLCFEFFFPEEILETDNIIEYVEENYKLKIKSYIAHEVTHIYEFYKKKVKGYGDNREMILNYHSIVMDHYLCELNLRSMCPSWNTFLYLIYLSSDFEINARVIQFFYSIDKKDKTFKEYMELFRKSYIFEEFTMLNDFDTKGWYKNLEYDRELVDDYILEQEWVDVDITDENRKELLLFSLVKDWDYIAEKLNDKNLERLPEQYIEDPLLFIESQVKIFNKYGKKLEKKIKRLYNNYV